MNKFQLLSDSYEPPEVKLEIRLKAYDKPPTPKTPVLTGYVTISLLQLKAIERVIRASEGGTLASLRVALWDSRTEEGGVTGVIEYKSYSKATEPTEKQTPSLWY